MARLSCSVHEIPIPLWTEVDRIFSVVSDWCQISLYEKHGLCFVTAVFEICSAYVDCGGEIDLIDMFGILTCFYHSMSSYQFTEVIEYHARRDFLKDSIVFAAVPVDQADGVFQFTKTCFLTPYADILEMPIFAFLKYWIYRTL